MGFDRVDKVLDHLLVDLVAQGLVALEDAAHRLSLEQLQRKVEEIIHFLLPFCTFSVGEMWLTDQSYGQWFNNPFGGNLDFFKA